VVCDPSIHECLWSNEKNGKCAGHQIVIGVGECHIVLRLTVIGVGRKSLTRTTTHLRVGVILAHTCLD
jgi:hypothetical protein